VLTEDVAEDFFYRLLLGHITASLNNFKQAIK